MDPLVSVGAQGALALRTELRTGQTEGESKRTRSWSATYECARAEAVPPGAGQARMCAVACAAAGARSQPQ